MPDMRFHHRMGPFLLHDLISAINVKSLNNENNVIVEDVKPLHEATSNDLTFFHNPKYLEQLKQTQAGFCLIAKEYVEQLPSHVIPLITETPYRHYAQIANLFYPNKNQNCEWNIHPTAIIDSNVLLPQKCSVGPYSIIEKNVQIGEGTTIGAHTTIHEGVILGDYCTIETNVTISHAIIHNQVTIQTGTRIGQEGFGFDMDEKGFLSVPQLGRVIIEDFVHIGANVTIDRGAGPDTIIGKSTRIDNLVQIAHNVQIGPYCVVVAQTGIAGSSKLGSGVILGGQVGIAGHLSLGDGVRVAAQSGVMKNLNAGEIMAGSPCVPIQDWHRQTIMLKRLIQQKGKQ